jgi:hypothetical protein
MADAESQEALMNQQRDIQLHRENLRGERPNQLAGAYYISEVVDSELEASSDSLDNLSAKDFPLANFDGEGVDTTEFKWLAEIYLLFDRAQYPHPRSGLVGVARQWAFDDTARAEEHLGLDEVIMDETFAMGAYSRAKRGEGMAQQESANKVTEERRSEIDGGDSSSGRGGIMGWLRRS